MFDVPNAKVLILVKNINKKRGYLTLSTFLSSLLTSDNNLLNYHYPKTKRGGEKNRKKW
jgi:hypothetical protein